MTKYKKLKHNRVDLKGKLRENIQLPKEKHLKYIPLIREHFNLDSNYTILKDYQVYENPKGNWIVVKDNKICMVLYSYYVKELFNSKVD